MTPPAPSLPLSPVELLNWLHHVSEYGEPTGADGREEPEPQLWLGMVLSTLADPACDVDGTRTAAALAQLNLTTARSLRGLLRLVAAEAAAAAVEYALGLVATSERVIDTVAGTQTWNRQHHVPPGSRSLPDDDCDPNTFVLELFVDTLREVQSPGATGHWKAFPHFHALLTADQQWAHTPAELLRVALSAEGAGLDPQATRHWCSAGPLASSGRGRPEMLPWLPWAQQDWAPAAPQDCLEAKRWIDAGLSQADATALRALDEGDPRRPTPAALAVMAALGRCAGTSTSD